MAFTHKGNTYEHVYYASKNGSDSNDGLTPQTAKLTIGAAINASAGHDGMLAVIIAPGSYDESIYADVPAIGLLYGDITGEYTGEPAGDVWITTTNTQLLTLPSFHALANLKLQSASTQWGTKILAQFGQAYMFSYTPGIKYLFDNVHFEFTDWQSFAFLNGSTYADYEFTDCVFTHRNGSHYDPTVIFEYSPMRNVLLKDCTFDCDRFAIISRNAFVPPQRETYILTLDGCTNLAPITSDWSSEMTNLHYEFKNLTLVGNSSMAYGMPWLYADASNTRATANGWRGLGITNVSFLDDSGNPLGIERFVGYQVSGANRQFVRLKEDHELFWDNHYHVNNYNGSGEFLLCIGGMAILPSDDNGILSFEHKFNDPWSSEAFVTFDFYAEADVPLAIRIPLRRPADSYVWPTCIIGHENDYRQEAQAFDTIRIGTNNEWAENEITYTPTKSGRHIIRFDTNSVGSKFDIGTITIS